MAGLTLGGLISGMDTDTVIQKLIDAESATKNLETKRKADVQAKQDAWNKIRTSVQNLRSKLDNIRFASNFRYRSATITDDSIASVVAGSGTTLGDHSLTVTQLATADKLWTTMSVADPAKTAVGVSGKLQIKTATATAATPITILATDTLNSIKDKINKSNAGVAADVVKIVNAGGTSYQLTLTSKTLGKDGQITLTETPDAGVATILGDTGLQFSKGGVWNETAPKNSIFTLDDRNYEMSTNTISDAIPGLTISLKKAQPAPTDGSARPSIGISVGVDPSRTVQAVKDWATAVNDLQDLLTTDTAYATDGQASGVLAGDFLARSIQQRVRGMISYMNGLLPTTMNQLSEAGVSTGAYGSDDFGKVLVNEDKLTAQLTQDPDAVARVFGALTDVSSSGAAFDMYKYVNDLLKFQTGSLDTTAAGLNDQVKQIDKRISDMDAKLQTREQELRAQFTQMEQAMSALQSQGNAFMAQMGLGSLSSSQK